MDYKPISSYNREQVNNFIMTQWFSTLIAIRGELVDVTALDGIVIYEKESIIGLLTYRIMKFEFEIISLDSLVENKGVGSMLITMVTKIAHENNCEKIKLITTNDNINAIRFYQKRGFDMVHFYYNALKESRRLKPSIPILGNYDIPIKHEIEFELYL